MTKMVKVEGNVSDGILTCQLFFRRLASIMRSNWGTLSKWSTFLATCQGNIHLGWFFKLIMLLFLLFYKKNLLIISTLFHSFVYLMASPEPWILSWNHVIVSTIQVCFCLLRIAGFVWVHQEERHFTTSSFSFIKDCWYIRTASSKL